ncbi:MAG: hypothetical protein IKZ55_06685 [Bacteroidales bacterium]|nr:hypothetical protein [Bacteroidales bacterium]
MEKEKKRRLEYVKRLFYDTEPEEAAAIWKRDAEKFIANGNWQEALECYENAEAFGANCGYELSKIYTYHLPDFEKAKSCLIRSDRKPIYFSLYMARLLSAFQRYEEALAYYLEAICGNIRGQQLDNLFQAGCKYNHETLPLHGIEGRDFEWLWDDETTGGDMILNFSSIVGELLKCYYDAGYSEMIDFKSLKQVLDGIVAKIDNCDGQ